MIKRNPTNFRAFGPDETKSNRMFDIFKVTNRQWMERIEPDLDEFLSPAGRLIDSQLSEHQAQGFLEGYVLTGRQRILCFIWIVFKSSRFYVDSTYEMSS
ncbi:hypothetical protein NW064_05905 [Mycoplasmopsis felis]|nr:hypothetical protein [Mycoplasmopsis felis]UWV84470.1 hypothetical protein NWE58_01020 [Mycoplasmopsis felis]UWW00701.1 hypothetical protein NW064_05905 [Mycoplasmopsis felis]